MYPIEITEPVSTIIQRPSLAPQSSPDQVRIVRYIVLEIHVPIGNSFPLPICVLISGITTPWTLPLVDILTLLALFL